MTDANTARTRVICCADDMGMRPDWDQAILRCIDAGSVHAVSVVTNGPVFGQALRALATRPSVAVGIHLNVLDGRPLSPPDRVPGLSGPSGRLDPRVGRFLVRYLTGRIGREAIEREWTCQIEAGLAGGLRPTHLNSHFHLHMLPGLFEVVLHMARRYRIERVRVADQPPWAAWSEVGAVPRELAKVGVLWALSYLAMPKLRAEGLEPVGKVRGLAMDAADAQRWMDVLRDLPPGPTELICHPGQFERQTAALLSPEVAARIRQMTVAVDADSQGDSA